MEEYIIDFVRSRLRADYHLYNVTVKPDSHLRNDFGLDSLDVMEIMMRIENKYGIHIPYDESDNVETVQDIVDVVQKYLPGR